MGTFGYSAGWQEATAAGAASQLSTQYETSHKPLHLDTSGRRASKSAQLLLTGTAGGAP